MNTKWMDAEEWLEKRVGKLTFGKMVKCIRECDEISQPLFVQLSLQGMVDKGRLGFKVLVEAA